MALLRSECHYPDPGATPTPAACFQQVPSAPDKPLLVSPSPAKHPPMPPPVGLASGLWTDSSPFPETPRDRALVGVAPACLCLRHGPESPGLCPAWSLAPHSVLGLWLPLTQPVASLYLFLSLGIPH
uniref:Uncharacterized protein n=1 Tax=Piliocolobus tephrosceles TaxID=591936 RepID=A0A8C9LHX7_9PRIM